MSNEYLSQSDKLKDALGGRILYPNNIESDNILNRVRAFLETLPKPISDKPNRSRSNNPAIEVYSKDPSASLDKEPDNTRSELEIAYSLIGRYGYLGNLAIGFASRNNPQNKQELDRNFAHKGKNSFFQAKTVETYSKQGWVNIYKYDLKKIPEENLKLIKDSTYGPISISVGEVRKCFSYYLPKMMMNNEKRNVEVLDLFSQIYELESVVGSHEFDENFVRAIGCNFLHGYDKVSCSGGYHFVNNFFMKNDIKAAANQ